jgi:hypothetical protein
MTNKPMSKRAQLSAVSFERALKVAQLREQRRQAMEAADKATTRRKCGAALRRALASSQAEAWLLELYPRMQFDNNAHIACR